MLCASCTRTAWANALLTSMQLNVSPVRVLQPGFAKALSAFQHSTPALGVPNYGIHGGLKSEFIYKSKDLHGRSMLRSARACKGCPASGKRLLDKLLRTIGTELRQWISAMPTSQECPYSFSPYDSVLEESILPLVNRKCGLYTMSYA